MTIVELALRFSIPPEMLESIKVRSVTDAEAWPPFGKPYFQGVRK